MTETATQAKALDLWNRAHETMWHLESWPRVLSDLWTDEKPTLYVNKEDGGYWLSKSWTAMQDRFGTLAEAKAAGEAFNAKAEAGMGARLVADAGLDPSAWSFEYREGARFRNREDASAVIEIDVDSPRPKPSFMAMQDEDGVGEYATAADAADALINRPAPGL